MADPLQTIVQRMIDAGESEENIATVIQHFKSQPAQPQQRSRTGSLYTSPTDSGISDFASGIGDAVNPMNLVHLAQSLKADPAGTIGQVAMTPLRMLGRMVTNPAHTLGEVSGGLGVNAAMGALKPTPPEVVGGVPLKDWEAAGVGKGSLDLMRNGPPVKSNVVSMPQRGTLRMIQPTQGNLALKPQAEAAPLQTQNAMAAPQPAAHSAPSGQLSPEQVRGLPSFSEQMRSPDLYGTPGKLWSSGAESGTADAANAAGTHRYLGEMESRWQHLMGDERGAITPDLLYLLGGGTALNAGYRIARDVAPHVPPIVQSPAFQNAVRAAVLANLAGRGVTPAGSQ